MFHVLFPLFGLLYHYQLSVVHNKREHVVMFVLKAALFIGFLVVIFWTWASQDLSLLITTGTCLIVVPIVAIIYSYTIFNMKCMARGRAAGRNADVAEGDQNNRRRQADAADLDERQEVVIREFQERRQNVQENFDRDNFGGGLAEAGQDLA